MRRDLDPLNAYLKGLQIEVPGAEARGRHFRLGKSQILRIPGNGLQRIFNRGSFAYHGRAYGWWQNIPRAVRGKLTIDGEATAEADYSALHASILYCKRGLKLNGDAYEVGNYPRDHVKSGFNIAVNAPNRRSAICALADRVGTNRTYAAGLLAAIADRHNQIGDAFFSDIGIRLMRIDSELILRALRASNDEGISALPVHDALIAPSHSIGRAAEKMVEAFETVVGRVNPCQIKIKGGKVPHMGETPPFSPTCYSPGP